MVASVIFAVWLLAAAPIATCFELTAPTSGTTLNFSASSIEIQWTGDDQGYSQVDLIFGGPFAGDGGSSFTQGIAENISISEGQYTWNPSNISDALQSNQNPLTTGNDYYLEAKLHIANSRAGATFPFDGYSVTGYPYTNTASAPQLHLGAAILTTLSVAFALC